MINDTHARTTGRRPSTLDTAEVQRHVLLHANAFPLIHLTDQYHLAHTGERHNGSVRLKSELMASCKAAMARPAPLLSDFAGGTWLDNTRAKSVGSM